MNSVRFHSSYRVRRVDLTRYAVASGDSNPIHSSPEAAAAAGLPDVVAHGMLVMGLAMRAVTEWSGDPGAVRGCSVRFLQPVLVGPDAATLITVAATVSAGDGPESTVTLLVRCEDLLVARVNAQVARVNAQVARVNAQVRVPAEARR